MPSEYDTLVAELRKFRCGGVAPRKAGLSAIIAKMDSSVRNSGKMLKAMAAGDVVRGATAENLHRSAQQAEAARFFKALDAKNLLLKTRIAQGKITADQAAVAEACLLNLQAKGVELLRQENGR